MVTDWTGVAGTFDVLHKGHHALLHKAFELGQPVLVGITSDDFANQGRTRKVRPSAERALEVTLWLIEQGYSFSSFRGKTIEDAVGFGLMPSLTKLVCSTETCTNALEINRLRIGESIPPLEIHKVDMVVDDGGEEIHATRILKGEIDAQGKLEGEQNRASDYVNDR